MTDKELLNTFARTRDIEGWLHPGAAAVIAFVDEIQRSAGITGNLFEIGVHHGRSALVLAACLRADEWMGVCDLFGAQAANVSLSGRGDEEIFRKNLARFGDPGRFRVFPKPSSQLQPDETSNTCRIFHIDGGHSAEETFTDFAIASRAVSERGVLVVDDLFADGWPGVIEGYFQYRAMHPDEWVPLLLGFNKGVFVRPTSRDLYWSRLQEPGWREAYRFLTPADDKDIEFCGTLVKSVWIDPAGGMLRRVSRRFPVLRNPATLAIKKRVDALLGML